MGTPDLVLYHGWTSSASRKVRLCLSEKGLAYAGKPMDLLKFEHHTDWYKKLNPSGIVPALLVDGHPLVESNLINEWLDETFSEPALRPADPILLHDLRLWSKYIDDICLPAIQKHNWMQRMHPLARTWSDAELERRLAAIPTEGRRRLWYRMARDPLTKEELDAALDVLRDMMERIEARLAATGWITGDAYSLSDIAAVPYVKRVEELMPDELAPDRRPHAAKWWRDITARPAYPGALIGGYMEQSEPGYAPG